MNFTIMEMNKLDNSSKRSPIKRRNHPERLKGKLSLNNTPSWIPSPKKIKMRLITETKK